ncbi:hypothetical protein A6A29_39005 [Streptomyces sp. TSRI0281]|nr:hypothetical protein A6A29_39005 [Streptomyces sp. TSRI0281]
MRRSISLGRADGFDALDLAGGDRDGCRAQALAEQVLGDEAADGVSDEHGRGVEGPDDLGVCLGDLREPDAGLVRGAASGLGDGRRATRA